MTLEGYDVCTLVWNLLVGDAGPGGVNTQLGGTPTTPGRIYQDVVPQPKANDPTKGLPAATIGLVAAPDTTTLGGAHVMSTVDVDVRVVGSGIDYGPLVPIARRVAAILDGAYGTTGESYAYRIRRVDFRRLPETDAGGSFRHLIGTYRTEAHPAP